MGLEDSQLFLLDKVAAAASITSDAIDLTHKYNDDASGYLQVVGHSLAGVTDFKIVLQDSVDGTTFVNREAVESVKIADLNKGRVRVGLTRPLNQYVKVAVTITGEAPTGSVSAFLTDKLESHNVYPATNNGDGSPY